MEERRKFYVSDWFDPDTDPAVLERAVRFAFERVEKHHGIKLGRYRRDSDEEAKMLASMPKWAEERGFTEVRVYVAEELTEKDKAVARAIKFA